MSALQVKTVVDPDGVDTLMNLKLDIFASLNVAKIGAIKSLDQAKKTAQVQILFKRSLPDGTVQSYQPIIDVPVFTLQGGGGYAHFPVQAGDNCLVLFADRRIDEWFESGAESEPGDPRMHDLSDGIALVGLNSLASSMPSYPTDKVVVSYGNSQQQILSDSIKLIAGGGAEIDLGTLVGIKNATTSLLTLMTDFINLLETLQVTGPLPLTAASISALEAFKAQFATLLQ